MSQDSYLVGLIGRGITRSLSPPMHEREADHHGLRYIYRILDLHDLSLPAEAVGDLLLQARNMGFNGLNITHPCKQLVLDYLDDVSEDARRLEAVNTILIEEGRFIGHNTDFSGFSVALARGLPSATLDVVVQLGAGGAGSAVAYALLKSGVKELVIVDVAAARAAHRARSLTALFPDAKVGSADPRDLPALTRSADGIVNCTPIGMATNPGLPLEGGLIQPRHWVADIVYRPIDTSLIRTAREKGCKVLDGGGMAVQQAVDAFELITGQAADALRMRDHFNMLVTAEAG